jgi:hypothetical protein
MSANILTAIHNIITSPVLELRSYYASRNRANNMGEALENYIKDVFAGTLTETDAKTYENLTNNVRQHIREMPFVETAETNELGRINNVDPLGVTDLRIRGMWLVKSPWVVFDDLLAKHTGDSFGNADFQFTAIINEDKFDEFEFDMEVIKEDMWRNANNFKIQDVVIKSPKKPDKQKKNRNAKLITYWR